MPDAGERRGVVQDLERAAWGQQVRWVSGQGLEPLLGLLRPLVMTVVHGVTSIRLMALPLAVTVEGQGRCHWSGVGEAVEPLPQVIGGDEVALARPLRPQRRRERVRVGRV